MEDIRIPHMEDLCVQWDAYHRLGIPTLNLPPKLNP